MLTMRELSRWIRDYGHDARHQRRLIADRFVWHQLWAAMNIVDDVDSAMHAYLDHEFPTDIGERYLRIYGAMQGLFLQQDALSDLMKAICPGEEVHENDVLKDIREARNTSIGHPTRLSRKGNLSTHGIVQISISKDGFDLLSYPEQDGKVFQHVPVRELIDKQRGETVRILTEVVNELRKQEENHRAQFRHIKLVQSFAHVSYAFEKISEEVRRNSVPILSSWAVDQLQESLDDFAERLEARGLNIDAVDSIKCLYDEIAHPLTELKKFINRESSEISSNKSAVVFATALHGHFDELRHIAVEIDEEYVSEPAPIVG